MKMIAKTFHGLEKVLSDELISLGAKEVSLLKRAVAFDGDLELMYKANYLLRTALRILQPIYFFRAHNTNGLYRKIIEFDWSALLNLSQTFAIDGVGSSKHFPHAKYMSLKVKDGIVDQFRKKTGKRPSIDTENPDIRFNVHLSENNFTISLDSSGFSLHKRGFRNRQHIAPLNEVLAAGLLKLTGWNNKTELIDPMCGSGTILVEAAMSATNTPAGYFRREPYSFTKWNDFDKPAWEKITVNANQSISKSSCNIIGGDIDQKAITACRGIIKELEFDRSIQLKHIPFDAHFPEGSSGTLIMNPPYGERMAQTDVSLLYQMIGSHLKHRFMGYDAWILSSNVEAMKELGLRPSKKFILFNGPLECKFQKFSMYKGSLKRKKTIN